MLHSLRASFVVQNVLLRFVRHRRTATDFVAAIRDRGDPHRVPRVGKLLLSSSPQQRVHHGIHGKKGERDSPSKMLSGSNKEVKVTRIEGKNSLGEKKGMKKNRLLVIRQRVVNYKIKNLLRILTVQTIKKMN